MLPMTTMETVAENLKSIRESKRMTQLEIAEKADISVNHYAKIERGEVVPGLDTFVAIMKAIGAAYTDVLPKL